MSDVKSLRLCKLATNQLATQASNLLDTQSEEDKEIASLSPYFCVPLPTVSLLAWPPSLIGLSASQKENKQDAFCEFRAAETRLGGKYSGPFHHLLIVLFHSQWHHITRGNKDIQNKRNWQTEEVWKTTNTVKRCEGEERGRPKRSWRDFTAWSHQAGGLLKNYTSAGMVALMIKVDW